MDAITKAITELRKNQLETDITALDHQAVVLALQATLLEIGGQKAAAAFVQHLAAAKHKLLVTRGSLQSDVQTLQTILEKSPHPKTPIH